MKSPDVVFGSRTCLVTAGVILLGLVYLGVRLKAVQVDDAAKYTDASSRQSVWRVKTPGPRGRILDRHGSVLAGNRPSVALVCQLSQFQRRSWNDTIAEVTRAVEAVGKLLGRKALPDHDDICRHVRHRERALPLTVFRDLSERELAVFCEHSLEFPGFLVETGEERCYPEGELAAHTIGYVGRRTIGVGDATDANYRIVLPETVGKAGLEAYYDGFLRGVAGERKLLVDARCITIREWTALEAQRGPDLKLTLDTTIQREVESQLEGLVGACVVMDPRNGDVLALASAPGYDLNRCVPIFTADYYRGLCDNPDKPLLNRAVAGGYAPGSTFKPITALAGLTSGHSAASTCECTGVFVAGKMRLHCTARWGHGEMDMRHALMKSCNPYFCNLGLEVGTNALVAAARAMGLGARTGIDFTSDYGGVVPDADWKQRRYREKWFVGDLVQMSIGQGMLLVSPLQMARVAGALGTGYLVTPHLKLDQAAERRALPFSESQLKVVRDGMRMVVAGDGAVRGTGWRAGEGVAVEVAGKTGTAEVGVGARKRNNTWFIAFAPADAPVVAVAMVVENGVSGGGTVAPKVAKILKVVFNDP